MVLDFDTREFLQNLKATKPPYECPIERCGKIYKSFTGIEQHIQSSHQKSNASPTITPGRKGRWQQKHNRDKSPTPPNLSRTPAREALTYAEAQRMIEVEVEDVHTCVRSIHRININEPMNIIFVDGQNGFNGSSALMENKSNRNEVKPEATVGKGKNKDRSKTGKAGKRNNGTNNLPPVEVTIPEPPKLPEPSFRRIEDYTVPVAPPRPSSYFRYIDKSQEELDEEVEYDMDEEDCAWLELINSKRKTDNLPEVPPDTFELLMDRLEKESYFLSQDSGKDVGPAIDEDAVCCICSDGECQNTNAILFCDMCNLAVHQECYGVPYIPEGQWLCRRCLQSPSRAVDCVLCPNKGGAFKQTDDNRWTHVVCALWIPEVCFANTVFLEPIDSIDNIPPARWKLTCYICKQRNVGACIQCHKTNCYVAFHVTCAQQAGLFMKMEAIEELTSNGLQRSVRKAAYCHTHTPSDENGTSLMGVYDSGNDEDSRSSVGNKKQQVSEAAFKEQMKKARKILAENRSALPVVSIPTIPPDRLTKTAAMINIPKRNQFIQRLLGYWTLKRQSRNGVPLLRRLQISYTASRRTNDAKNDDEQVKKMKEELKYLQRLRQDLERARLLSELIRKREKLKREYIKVLQLTYETQMQPFNVFLKKLLGILESRDTQKFFTEPVNVKEVPDYLEFVTNPMDFSTMRSKISTNQYTSLCDFETDFNLIVDNCQFYNDKDTVYYKAASRLREFGKSVFKEAKLQTSKVGYNEKVGVHFPPSSIDEPKDSFARTAVEQKRLEAQLKELTDELNKTQQAKSGGSRTRKIKMLTGRIASVKREISVLNPTGFTLSALESSKSARFDKSDESLSSASNSENRPMKNGGFFNSLTEAKEKADAVATAVLLKPEGRRTMNSVSASVSFTELLNKNPTKEGKSLTTESPSKKTKSRCNSRKPLKSKSSETLSPNANGDIDSDRFQEERSSACQIASTLSSPLPSSSNSCTNNQNSSHLSSSKNSPPHKTADASTCTPMTMFSASNNAGSKTKTPSATTGSKKRSGKGHGSSRSKKVASSSDSTDALGSTAFPPPTLPATDSFKIYRSNMNCSSDSDAKSNSSHSSSSSGSSEADSESSRSSSCGSSSASESSYDHSDGGTQKKAGKNSPKRPTSRSSRSDVSIESQHLIPLEPLDLVWAKCRGYPWYPALIVNPEMPKTGYFHNGVPIPVPPDDVLALQTNHEQRVYLVLFFDAKRTWQWLPRNKLEPLGVDPNLDKAKLTESRKQTDKKAVKKAFEKAIVHRCRVTGESNDFSAESSNED